MSFDLKQFKQTINDLSRAERDKLEKEIKVILEKDKQDRINHHLAELEKLGYLDKQTER